MHFVPQAHATMLLTLPNAPAEDGAPASETCSCPTAPANPGEGCGREALVTGTQNLLRTFVGSRGSAEEHAAQSRKIAKCYSISTLLDGVVQTLPQMSESAIAPPLLRFPGLVQSGTTSKAAPCSLVQLCLNSQYGSKCKQDSDRANSRQGPWLSNGNRV